MLLESYRVLVMLPALDDERAPVGNAITAGLVARTLDEAIGARTTNVDEADLLRLDDDGGRPIDAYARRWATSSDKRFGAQQCL